MYLKKFILEFTEKILNVEFKGSDILRKQIIGSNVTLENAYAYISVKFSIGEKADAFPYLTRVPVEIRLFRKNSIPIVFLLHVKNGFVSELEIFNADSSSILFENIDFGGCFRVEYEIDVKLKYLH